MYIMGQNNRMHRCLTTLGTQIVLKKLHEKMEGRRFLVDIITNIILDAGYWWPTLFKDILQILGESLFHT